MPRLKRMTQTVRQTTIGQFLIRYKYFSLALVSIVIGLILELTGMHTAAHWLLGIVSVVTIFPLLWDMWQDFRSGSYGLDILAITAIVTSVLLHQYWAAIVIVVMLTGGEALEDYAEHRARVELDSLLTRAPQMAHVLRGKQALDIPARDVRVGDKVIVKPGEVVPVDAVIIEGSASFDQSSLTGESLPEPKAKDDTVLSGSINIDAVVTVRAIHSAADSQYEQIIKLVRSAAASQSPFVRLADRYSIPFTVTAYAIAVAVWIVSGEPIRFLEVIVVATPCPLLLAAPIALISGMSRASKYGIIVKTGAALERLAETQTLAFDKTGTLTVGQPTVDKVEAYHGYDKNTVLELAAGLEQSSNHVLARAIVDGATSRHLTIAKAKHVKEFSGKGLEAHVKGKDVLVGRLTFMHERSVTLPPRFNENVAQTATFVAVNDELVGMLTFKDEPRPETKSTLAQLKKLGIKNFLMMTGDNQGAAAAVAKQLGIKNFLSEALPADKLTALDAIDEDNRLVAFVGDGVNDAPVLTAADVGIALGARGSTAASESADIVIMPDDLRYVARAVSIAKRTFSIARQSILVGIGISIVLMLAFATGRFSPLMGAIIQEVVDVVVIFNALRAHSAKDF